MKRVLLRERVLVLAPAPVLVPVPVLALHVQTVVRSTRGLHSDVTRDSLRVRFANLDSVYTPKRTATARLARARQ